MWNKERGNEEKDEESAEEMLRDKMKMRKKRDIDEGDDDGSKTEKTGLFFERWTTDQLKIGTDFSVL